MCCFNHPIDHVFSTRIFVGARNGSQLTVYQAGLVGSRIEMVLPVRTAGAQDLEFIDLKSYPGFFQDCERAFSLPPSRSKTTAVAGAAPAGLLEVKQIGDYKVSFAPSAGDLARTDPSVFQLSPRLGSVVSTHYPAGFGFVIFKPDHNGEMHPLAYRHPVKPGEKLFVPTRHEHGHEGPPDWDHRIYHQGDAAGVPAQTHEVSPMPAGDAFAAALAAGLPVPAEIAPELPLRRIVRRGRSFRNGDLEIRREPGDNRAGIGLTAIGAGAAALGYRWWLRRDSLK